MPRGNEKTSQTLEPGRWKWVHLRTGQGMGRGQFPTLGTFLAAFCWTEVDRGHEADQLHGLCLH